ncbi:MAG: UvrD-helicase domain-containing protein [Patescibacteria group bacterium]|nr:UvrD-helicase domain-containing protein [Patescibacteria group bacterium]
MFEIIFILIIVLFFVFSIYYETYKANKGLLDLRHYKEDFQRAVEEFESFLDGAEYFNNRKYENWSEKYKYLLKKINFNLSRAVTEKIFKEIIQRYLNYQKNARKIIDEYNEKFIKEESERILPILDKMEIKSDSRQRESIVCGEDCSLVVAGAGTGKTQTVLGKVAYLYSDQKIKPEDILLLSFTRKATQELKDRIHKISNKLHIGTFNSIGFEIIGKALGNKPSVAFENKNIYQKFINKRFNSKLKSDKEFLDLSINYFLYYLYPIELSSGYKNKDEYYKSLKAGNILTIKKEQVKSVQEAMIANFLYAYKIDYEYEKKYEYKTSNSKYSQYKPDFYLSDYNIYLEHFGIDRDRNTHFTNNEEQNKIDSTKYKADMEEKRNFHLQYKTKLIETYSYEFFEGDWQGKLTEKLQKFGVKLEKRPENEILAEIKKVEYIRIITPLICTFLNLMKSCGSSVEDMKNKFEKSNDVRGLAFMKIFERIYELYDYHLKENNEIDFNDMLLSAAQYVNEDKYVHNYKYIIIDEFQDFSFSKYGLIRAMLDQNPNTKLLCVGDDWQSIFRFSGSDVNLMLNFKKYFGFTKTLKLEKCHRFNNQLAKITNNFILTNKHQLKKKLYSDIQVKTKPMQIINKTSYEDILPLKNILEGIDTQAQKDNIIVNDVLLLGRFNHDIPENIDYDCYKNIKNIEFTTIHLAKGLTCDYAIILNNKTGKYGFPANFSDDPIINMVLSEVDPSSHSEERRLMYVAMTRAKNKVFLLNYKKNESIFIRELERENKFRGNIKLCKECTGEMIERDGTFSRFYGCSNFPYCRYTEKIARN